MIIDQNKVYSIKELTLYLKTLLDHDPILSNVWLQGEISNYTHHSSGHMYFTLKDEESRLRCIMFAGNNRFLKFIPKNGMKVMARGYISIFERDGQYQFYIQEMQPDGIGQLYLAYEQLKEKLEKEGLFDPLNKKLLPPYPQTIGIITSPTGAAIRDMIITMKRRYPLVNILLFPVLVQGQGAAESIAEAIQKLNQYAGIDILIVGRGGGSIEELWAFNEEIVARSIYQSKIPVISAVGHETDFTIADFVADIRAATPTAAAEIAVPHIDELKVSLAYLVKRLEKRLLQNVEHSKNLLSNVLRSIIFRRPEQLWSNQIQQLDRLEERLNHSLQRYVSIHKEKVQNVYQQLLLEKPDQKLKREREKLNFLKRQLIRELKVIKDQSEKKLAVKMGQLDALSPLKVMQRGFSIAYNEEGTQLLKSIQQVNLGDIIRLRLQDGQLHCQVWSLEEEKNEK